MDENKKDIVEVPRSALEQILARQKEQEQVNKDQAEKIRMLTEVADKGRLARYEEKNRPGGLLRRATVRTWEGSLVLGWKMTTDEVGLSTVDGRTVLIEKQIVSLYLDTGNKEPEVREVPLLDFSRNYKTLPGDIVKQSKGEFGETYTLRLEDGRNIELDIRFIN